MSTVLMKHPGTDAWCSVIYARKGGKDAYRASSADNEDMGFDIKFDPPLDQSGRNLERQVKNIANDPIERFGGGLHAACDEVFAPREGTSPDQLFAELRVDLHGR